MKNIHLTSIETVYKVLVTLGVVGFFAVGGGLTDFFMPRPFNQISYSPLIPAAISVGSAFFVWSAFRLIRPVRAGRGWQIAEVILVPLYWLLLMLAVYVCLGCLIEHEIQQMGNLVETL